MILRDHPDLHTVVRDAPRSTPVANWHVKYWSWQAAGPKQPPTDWNAVVSGAPLKSVDTAQLEFRWGAMPPDPAVPADHFAVVAATEFATEERDYLFEFGSDDGIRVYLDDELILDSWHWRVFATDRRRLRLTKGTHRLKVEYFEIDGLARLSGGVYPAGREQQPMANLPESVTAAKLELAYVRDNGDLLISAAGKSDALVIARDLQPWSSPEWIQQGREIAVRQGQRVLAFDPQTPAKRRTLVELDAHTRFLSVHPDGVSIAIENTATSAVPRIQVLNSTTERRFDLVPFGYDPSWSADGQTLAVWNVSDPQRRSGVLALYKGGELASAVMDGMEDDNAKTAKLSLNLPTHPSGFIYATVSHDGQSVAFGMKGEDGTRQIGIISVEGRQVRQATRNAQQNLMPAWSPDGRFLAYLRGSAVPYELAVLDLHGGTETIVAKNAAMVRPAWRVRP
jgi:hypothetical protein